MKNANKLSVLLAVAIFAGFAGGCSVMDKAYVGTVGLTDPDSVKLSTTLKWMHPQANIRPASGGAPKVYLRVRNSSGVDLDITSEIRQELTNAGFELTRNIDEANFYLNADLRFFGESASKQYGAVMASTVVGAGAGAGISAATGGDALVGGVAGAAGGYLLGEVMANRNKIREISLVVDLTIGERIAGGVKTTRTSSDTMRTNSNTSASTGGGYESGSSAAVTGERQSVSVEDQFLYHPNRAVVTAKKMNLTLDEARPVVVKRLSRGIGSVLP